MKLILPSFNVCIEIVEYFNLYGNSKRTRNQVIAALAKTPSYISKSIDFLISIDIIVDENDYLFLSSNAKTYLNSNVTIHGIIKYAIAQNEIFKEYFRLIGKGKNSKQSAQYVITSHHLKNNFVEVQKILEGWYAFLNKEFITKNSRTDETSKLSFISFDKDGTLIYDEKSHADFITDKITTEKKILGEGSTFVDHERIKQLKLIENKSFDLKTLIKKCDELNITYSTKCYFAVGMLTRSIIDHVPPIFNKVNFNEVAGGYGSRSFRESMMHLDKSSRKISDAFLHTPIRTKEILPTKTQVNFSSDLDVLLSEIIRILG